MSNIASKLATNSCLLKLKYIHLYTVYRLLSLGTVEFTAAQLSEVYLGVYWSKAIEKFGKIHILINFNPVLLWCVRYGKKLSKYSLLYSVQCPCQAPKVCCTATSTPGEFFFVSLVFFLILKYLNMQRKIFAFIF